MRKDMDAIFPADFGNRSETPAGDQAKNCPGYKRHPYTRETCDNCGRDLMHHIAPQTVREIKIPISVETETPDVITPAPGYLALAGILQAAHDQAARGKGRERHSDDKAFLDQPIMQIARMLGDTGGHAYQIMKKSQEANRMVKRGQYDAAVAELYGVINYAAAAVLLIREIETKGDPEFSEV